LELIEPTIEAVELVMVFARLAAVTEHLEFGRQIGVVRRDHAAVAEPAQVLGWIKAKGACQPDTADPALARERAVRLAGILNKEHVFPAGGLERLVDTVQVSGLAIEVDGKDGLGVWPEDAF